MIDDATFMLLSRSVFDSVLERLERHPEAKGDVTFKEGTWPEGGEPYLGRTAVYLESPPLTFYFDYALEVAVGWASEVYCLDPSASDVERLAEDIEQILTLPIRVDEGPRKVIVEFLGDDGKPWLRHNSVSIGGPFNPTQYMEEPFYAPAFRRRSETQYETTERRAMIVEADNMRLSRSVFDSVLERLERHPGAKGDVRFKEGAWPEGGAPGLGGTAVYLESPPLTFRFSHVFEVAVGSSSEVYCVVPSSSNAGQLAEDIERLLTSPIRVDRRRRKVKVEFLDDNGEAWIRNVQRTSLGLRKPVQHIEPFYAPAFRLRSEAK